MDEIKKYTDYCTGCGLCHSVRGIQFHIDEKGYPVPELTSKDIDFCNAVCPGGGQILASEQLWGYSEATYYAWSTNDLIRKSASSGGVLTGLCLYLLDNKLVDGIVQVRASDNPVYGTETVINTNANDVLRCMGSRYSISSPLMNIKEIVTPGMKYAFVGKPCDVAALRAYMQTDAELKTSILYMFSFFCAGMPSVEAQHKLLKTLDVNESDCSGLQYRGNGWPGYATATCKDGSSKSMTYDESWGKILGRDVRHICRFCFDGIGLSADIACGDAWYMGEDKKPIFSEKQGRNVVFVRTEEGKELFQRCLADGCIEGSENSLGELQFIQKYQYERRATMSSKIAALRYSRKSFPTYPKQIMKQLAKHVTLRRQLSMFKGTLERCRNGKI